MDDRWFGMQNISFGQGLFMLNEEETQTKIDKICEDIENIYANNPTIFWTEFIDDVIEKNGLNPEHLSWRAKQQINSHLR